MSLIISAFMLIGYTPSSVVIRTAHAELVGYVATRQLQGTCHW